MAEVVVLGAGVAGHTAALHLKRMLPKGDTVTVVSPKSDWNWIPSNIWVGVGKMAPEKVVFPLAPIYRRKGINFVQGKAVSVYVEGNAEDQRPFVEVELTQGAVGSKVNVHYDFLVNATGPQLRFDATEGLGPEANSQSVCTASHATQASAALDSAIALMESGKKQTFVIGMGHGTCTCEGAAFEYVFNVEHVLRERGVREMARVVYLTNEHEVGDFGVGGMSFEKDGLTITSEQWMTRLFAERGIEVIAQAHVTSVEPTAVNYDLIDGTSSSLDFDFAMLLPPFKGVGLTAIDREGNDVSETVFAPSGFMKVDANYESKPFEDWSADDWPSTYESPSYPNVFATGIAFAPPHAISRPYKTPKGDLVAPSPPRTGMPSGVQGKTVAETINDRIRHGDLGRAARRASMAEMGAACIASVGAGIRNGAAATITMSPIVPDTKRYGSSGRIASQTFGEIGLAGHWMKRLLHTLFIYKAKARPGWWLIPE